MCKGFSDNESIQWIINEKGVLSYAQETGVFGGLIYDTKKDT